jgi:hypothetical protein
MERKAKYTILVPIAIVFCILYLFFALRPLGTELHFSPDWTVDIAQVKERKQDDELIPFRLGQNIGYFTSDGRVVSSLTFPFKAAISDKWYALYGADNVGIPFFSADGTQAGTLTTYGFPYFEDDRIYDFLPGGSSFVQCDNIGNIQWRYEYYAPITAFDSSEGGTVAGFADGTITSFTKDGKVSQQFAPGGSDFPIILGTGISKSGNLIACVSGQKKQRFVLSQKDGDHSKIIFHEFLDKDQTKQVIVKFNKKDDMVYYDYNGSLGIVDVKKLKSSHIPLEGSIVQIEESDVDSLMFILSRTGSMYTVTALEPFDHPAASFTFKANAAFIQVRGNALFVGKDNKISRMTISRK